MTYTCIIIQHSVVVLNNKQRQQHLPLRFMSPNSGALAMIAATCACTYRYVWRPPADSTCSSTPFTEWLCWPQQLHTITNRSRWTFHYDVNFTYSSKSNKFFLKLFICEITIALKLQSHEWQNPLKCSQRSWSIWSRSRENWLTKIGSRFYMWF